MADLATLVRQHAERYDTGDLADAAAYDVLTKAAEVLEMDLVYGTADAR